MPIEREENEASSGVRRRTKKPSSLTRVLKNSLAPVYALIAIGTVILAAAKKSDEVAASYRENPILVGLIAAVIAILALWAIIGFYAEYIGRYRVPYLRLLAIGTVVAGYLCLATYSLWCSPLGFCEAAAWRPLRASWLIRPAMAEQTNNSDLVVEDVFVDRTRSSFKLTNDDRSIDGTRDNVVRPTIEVDRRMAEVFRLASCDDVEGEQPIDDALPIWRAILQKRDTKGLASQLANYNAYRDLIRKGGRNTFFELVPNASELAALKRENADYFLIIMRWLSRCVGLADPVLVWTLKNNSERALVLASVAYDVLEVGQVRGAGPAAVEPIDVEAHDLYHASGTQNRDLNPHVEVPSKSSGEIRIRYRLDARDWGYTWLLRATFRATDGTAAASKEMKIFGAKPP